jgi:hypothetical protein
MVCQCLGQRFAPLLMEAIGALCAEAGQAT